MSPASVTDRVRLTGSADTAGRRRPARRWWADLAGSTALASVVVVAVWWLHNGGARGFSGPGGAATSIGRLTGLIAADLLLLQVLLMARIPWVERGYGQDTLARRHRLIGYLSFWVMIGHVVLITVGYAQTGGEGWTGADFVASAAARWYWCGRYATAVAAVLLFRLGLPAMRSAYHRLRVHEVVPEAPGVVSVYLSGHRLDRLPARAGQFFLWRFLDGPGWTRAHPYTLSRAPARDLLRITVKDLGDGSSRVAALRPGSASPPCGHCSTAPVPTPRPGCRRVSHR